MHVRLSSVRGTSIVDDRSKAVVARLDDALIHPDTGRIEGFFVVGLMPEAPMDLFLSSGDIISWGMAIHLRSSDRLAPPSELIRLQSLLQDARSVLGQPVRIRGSRRTVGVCRDVQFDTRHLKIEWIFPYRFYVLQQRPIAATEIGEITPEAIWISDPLRLMKDAVLKPAVQQGVASLQEKPLVA